MPGYEGSTSVKWIRRIQFGRDMFQMREETSKYADHLQDGRTWQYSVMCEVRSHIIVPSGGMHLGYRGPMEIRGIAWSGRGAIASVEVSTNGGRTWSHARLHQPIAPKMATMFTLPWQWDGRETTIKSRALDDAGNRQPTHEYVARYGPRGVPYNAIQSWRIHPNGTITHVWA
jgi:sulfane dehydrogenase subunit SoxC